ncbi:MAG: winged helix-turn-helix transcriptional regulator [Bacteroidales bacterium]|nr:winged helix-turn-helix transcriptional regulator [Bacteroidales bacterium]
MSGRKLTPEQLDNSAQILKAMAHPIRVAIMALIEGKKMNVTQIYEELNLEQSVVSHHLGILRDKGVLLGERDGKNVYYSYKNDLLSSVIECVTNC